MKKVMGIGVNDGDRPTRIKGLKVKQYTHWMNMLSRATSKVIHKEHPTYKPCIVSENFKNYTYFYDWCEKQVGFDNKDTQLDKDLIFKGNVLYSEDTCFFIPRRLNTLLLSRQLDRGEFPVGVSFNNQKMKYQARVSDGNIRMNAGFFDNPVSAFYAYKESKENLIKIYADKYRNEIDERAYRSLIEYRVEIND